MSNSETKTCTKCKVDKSPLTDFYLCQGKCRSECKACTIKKNVKYQKRTKAWKNRFVDSAEHRSYMIKYYAKNKKKFAEYRLKFKEKHPDYYKEYNRKRKEIKNGRQRNLPSTHTQREITSNV